MGFFSDLFGRSQLDKGVIIEKAIEKEELVKFKELKDAYSLLSKFYRINPEMIKENVEDLETAKNLLVEVEKHNERIREGSIKLAKDIGKLIRSKRNIEGLLKEGRLDAEWREILKTTQRIGKGLGEIVDSLDKSIGTIKTLDSTRNIDDYDVSGGVRIYRMWQIKRLYVALPKIMDELQKDIPMVEKLLVLERQVEKELKSLG